MGAGCPDLRAAAVAWLAAKLPLLVAPLIFIANAFRTVAFMPTWPVRRLARTGIVAPLTIVRMGAVTAFTILVPFRAV